MRASNILIGLLCCAVWLGACHSEDEIMPQRSKEDIWYWGYFKGEINGHAISLENEEYTGPIHSLRSAYYFSSEWEVFPDSINRMGTLIHYNDSSELRITLYDLSPSERYVTVPESRYWYENSINVTVFNNSSPRRKQALYIPSEENPFRIKIVDVSWVSIMEPIIEVELDGILYSDENQENRMIIKGVYGTR